MTVSDEPQGSDSMDPLHSFTGVSLFPRSFRDLTKSLKPKHHGDLESIHELMKSIALRSPRKYLEQAKAIVDGDSELLNLDFSSLLASEDKNEDLAAKGTEEAQERRPALGRKRAQFSLKPNSSQPSMNIEPTLDIDQLQDPEEYFLAHEKFENAKKELQRQRGGSTSGLVDTNPSKPERRRRPGILGRKSVNYKHHYSPMLAECDATFISSQETMSPDICSSATLIPQPETADSDVELREQEFIGSISKTENRVNGLLDELLSDNCANLDGIGALSFLQERLQIKPPDLDKLCIPDFHNVGKNDIMDLKENLPKSRNRLSDVTNLVTTISRKTPVNHKQVTESPAHSLDSPTPPKSPFASIFLLKNRIVLSDLPHDPFSALDLSPARNLSSVERVSEDSGEDNARKELGLSGELKSSTTEIVDLRGEDTGSHKVITGDSAPPKEKPVNDNLSRHDVDINVGSGGSCGDAKDKSGTRNMDERVTDDEDSRPNTEANLEGNGANKMKDNESRFNTDIVISVNRPNELDDNVGNMTWEASSSGNVNFENSFRSCTDFQSAHPNETKKHVEDMPQNSVPHANINNSAIGELDGNQSHHDQSSSAALGPDAMEELFETADVIPAHIENLQDASIAPLNQQSTEERPPRDGRKRKTLSHRQSLAGAGTYWEAGVRRSKRIKMRPLEYWKGERFLYGRIHESLTTVIGLKYVSPAKGDGKPSVKVKSFVSDEYKELVDLAALH